MVSNMFIYLFLISQMGVTFGTQYRSDIRFKKSSKIICLKMQLGLIFQIEGNEMHTFYTIVQNSSHS